MILLRGKVTLLLAFALFTSCLSLACASKGNIFSLNVGDCFNGATFGEIEDVEIVKCSEPHNSEVFAKVQVDRSSWPGESYIGNYAEESCVNRFRSYVGKNYYDSIWYVAWLSPTKLSWEEGDDREIVCLISPEYGRTSEEARNSRK